MRKIHFAASWKAALRVVCLIPFVAALVFGQQQVNLAAGAVNLTLPDGATVPMWGYSCQPLDAGVTSTATCAALNTKAGAGWSPVVITVPTGQSLTIKLTNNLSFTPAGPGATPNKIPTSLMIVGQIGGGLGDATQRTTAASPAHATQTQTTWPTVTSGGGFTPPTQPPRVQSFGTEVAAGATTALTWTAPRPGTYLIESGTHPSIQGTMGLYGILVVTAAPTATGGTETAAGTAYPGVTYDADVPLLMSEIDPVQNAAVTAAVNKAGFSETAVWSGQPNQCGNPASANYQTCYPPVVNYTPLYYMFNGVAFNKTNASASLFSAFPATLAPTSGTGSVLVRFVNAGSRMHVPSIVGPSTGTPAVGGFALVAEDGNPLPGVRRVQNEVFMAAGKTYDVMINAPATGSALPVYDRELSLSGGGNERDAGMLAYLGINGSALPAAGALGAATANPDNYNAVLAGQTLTVSDPSKGVLQNDVNVYGVTVATPPTQGMLSLNTNGTFTYVANANWATSDSFVYCGNGTTLTSTTPICTTVTLGKTSVSSSGVTAGPMTYTAKTATYLAIKTPGVLSAAADGANLPITVDTTTVTPLGSNSGLLVYMDANGGFTANAPTAGTYAFTYQAQNSQGKHSSSTTVTLIFPSGSGLKVSVVDGKTKALISDYRWIIEEDETYFIDPNKQTNTNTNATTPLPTLALNFATSFMPFVAQGCTGPKSCESGQSVLGVPSVCDISTGVCRPGTQKIAVDPSQVVLDPNKRYYISVLPGDAADPFYGAGTVGHGMGGTSIGLGAPPVTVLSQPSPYPTGKLSAMVYEDDFPLNGEQDTGGGVDILATNEPGLGGFNIVLFDVAGQLGDATGQMSYDMFNQPLSNSLAGQIDPATGMDACPITKNPLNSGSGTTDPTATGITGMIVTCPKYESDGKTFSPLAGQVVINNLMPGLFIVQAIPGADRIARGEEWLQTNTLDGQHPHDAYVKIGEPAYFQEYGPAGFHVAIGFANPAIINARRAAVCNGSDQNLTGANCTNTVTGKVTGLRLSRPPDERLYSSGSRDAYAWSQCYVSLGDPDGEDFAFTKCNADGTFTLSGLPDGQWRMTLFDQWNDQIVDGLSTPVYVSGGKTTAMGDLPVPQWQANVHTRTFVDDNKDGVWEPGEAGIPLINTTVRYRDGSLSNNLVTDFDGLADFNEVFPLFAWYAVEADTTRYKITGTHTVYDAGGPSDGSASCGLPGYPPCGGSTIGKFVMNTYDPNPLPSDLSVPGAVYCSNPDCTNSSIANGPTPSSLTNHSTGRIDPPWVADEAWQGYMNQFNFIEFGKAPYVPGENGGIKGHVVYASTRPFDDPQMLVQTQWEPLVPRVAINLYKEGFAADGITPTRTLVDTTQTSSWDDFAQGFHVAADGTTKIPNISCPGQSQSDLFFFSLANQPSYLDWYSSQHGGPAPTAFPYNAQYKCYDGMHSWNQLQPAPYDGMYSFPSVTSIDPVTGKATGTNCTGCVTNPDSSDAYRYGQPMLPAGTYVVEVVVPPGYELVKEEDKNILIGDNFIAPVTQEFGGMGNIFILPDQAEIRGAYNANNAQNPTQSLGATPLNGIVPGFTPEPIWPCVGDQRIVPDYISLFPQSKQVAPFAGATRNLCDRKEVTLGDQMGAIAKFFIYTSTHTSAHFSGIITDDFTVEFDPFSPTFGEKFSPPNLPVSFRDWTGAETSRVYSDQWGAFNGLTFSTWEVNPPNPTGYSPNMMITCMNDRGDGPIPDPLFDPSYNQFCYEWPFMPGRTSYMDTPVFPNTAFATGYDHPDCAYPDATPAVSEVDGDGVGPWVSVPGKTITITALGDKQVTNYGYTGPSATTPPFNQRTINRHYGFGGTQGTGSVTIGGVPATVQSWNDTTIVVLAPANVPSCPIQQQAQYGGPGTAGVTTAKCGQLLITAGNGKQSVDAVTVTIGGKAPTRVANTGTIQAAIDAAAPGDLIIVTPGVYKEMLLMWKPVRLQGVGAASAVLDGNTQPAGKMDPWRREVNCLFGLALNGQPYTDSSSGPGTNPYDSSGTYACPGTGWKYASGGPNYPAMVVDRIPLEGILGWDTTVNGNLAEQLQEPSLMGAYEGAGITVLGKGVNIPAGFSGGALFGSGAEASFPTGSALLTAHDCGANTPTSKNPYPTNFQCNPSLIDGLSITDSSQGGGGIFAHAWTHNLEIANNRVYSNSGSLAGGITIGQGEFPDAYLNGSSQGLDYPGSCSSGVGLDANTQLPYCLDLNVNVHNNSVTLNTSVGDELFTGTPAGAGGVTFCTGADYYKFNHNWVCGNMSTGDGGGFSHIGFSYNGDIEHNSILFNQSLNPTIPTNGGGIIIMGAAPDGSTLVNGVATECGTVTDNDCVPGLSDGTGPGLVINANLIQGNAAESGTGGGIAFQGVNGTDISRFPSKAANWYSPQVTNNIIVNNVAGWDGAGVSVQDSLAVSLINNTIASNDTTASSGVLFNTIGAPLASNQSPPTNTLISPTQSAPQPAGLVAIQNSPQLVSSFTTGPVTCPTTHPNCTKYSFPLLANDMFWQNRSFYIGVGAYDSKYQQHVVALYNAFTPNLAVNQSSADATTANGAGAIITGGTGSCVSGASYWDIGVRGDTGPSNHASGLKLAPTYSVLTDVADYPGLNNQGSNPTVVSQYCNGSRTPPEFGSNGYQVPPGITDATMPNPIFSLLPGATVDEGNNWVNMQWGPLSLTNPTIAGTDGNYGGGGALGNYALASTSPAIDYIPPASPTYSLAPKTDFFGNPRPALSGGNKIDIGAVEYQATMLAPALTSITPNSGARGTTVNVTLSGSNLSGTQSIAVSGSGVTVTNIAVVNPSTVTATFTVSATAGLTARTVTITTSGGTTPTASAPTFTVTGPTLTGINQASGARGASLGVTITGTDLTGATSVNAGSGVTATAITVNSAGTSLTATFTIASSATLSTRNVTVVTPDGTTPANAAVQFTVTGPTVATITPAQGARGTGVAVTITGTDLTGATSVNAGSGVTAAGITVNPAGTSLTATFNIASNASLSTRNVTVVTPDGTTPANTAVQFTVLGATVAFAGPTPVLTSSPANATIKTGTITVSNTATGPTAGPLTLTAAPTITKTAGAAASTFSITGGTCGSGTVVSPGGNCTITVQYAPSGTATSTAHVTITDTGATNASQNSANFNAN